MYHLTQEAIIKLFEISILLTLHHNFKCGFSQNFNVFFHKIHIWDYDDQLVDKNQYFQNLSLPWFILWNFFISPVEIIKKIDIFTDLGLLWSPFDREAFW